MTIEEQIAAMEAENARLQALTQPTPAHQRGEIREVLDLVRHAPGFKAFCARKLTKRAPSMAEILAKSRKATEATIRAFMKPKGIWSILKDGPYTTGRVVETRYEVQHWNKETHEHEGSGEYNWNGPFNESARLVQVTKGNKWEWTSELQYAEGAVIRDYVPKGQDLAQDDAEAPAKGKGPVSAQRAARRAIIESWLDLYRADGLVPGLAELKTAVRTFEKGEEAA